MADTPIEKRGSIYLKRDDLYQPGNIRAWGGKARSCFRLVKEAKDRGFAGVVTAGSRSSPQVSIVANIAKKLGIACVAFAPQGDLGNELIDAQNQGAHLIQVFPGYNTVICARCKEFATANNYKEIPFGMMCPESINETAKQYKKIPPQVKRIVVPIGSGMSALGIIEGMRHSNKKLPIIGIVVGADPTKTLNRFCPDWQDYLTLQKSQFPYQKELSADIDGVELDCIYEAKCVPYLSSGDLLWIVGIRNKDK